MGNKPSGSFSKYSIAGFLEELGSASASPGGGAAAALTGALGVSLVEMVSRINERRRLKKHAKKTLSASFKKNISRLEKYRGRLAKLIQLDTEAYLRLSRFPKDKKQSTQYQNTLKHAAGVPLEICELAVQSLEIGQSEIYRTSRWLASDLAEAGILLEASFRSGRLNVEINLRSIHDRAFVKKTKNRLNTSEKKVAVLNKRIGRVLEND